LKAVELVSNLIADQQPPSSELSDVRRVSSSAALTSAARANSSTSGLSSTSSTAVTSTASTPAVIENLRQFYAWFAALDDKSSDDQNFEAHVARLRAFQQCTGTACEKVEAALRRLQEIEEQYRLVTMKTGELHRE
jgi:hypothetical protein